MNRPLLQLRLPTLLLALCMLAGAGCAVAQTGAVLKACASHSPPFVMFAKEQPVGGFSYVLLQALAQHLGRPLQVKVLPWARCLQEVKTGATDLAIDAYEDSERHKTFRYSSAYHRLTPQIFYQAGGRADGLPIRTLQGLQRLRGCGVHEYTYEHYGLDAATLDRGAADDRTMLLKLKAGHCDYAVEELEYIVGGRSFVADWPDESDLKSIRPPWAQGPTLHFLVGKENAQSAALLAQVDQAIAWAEKSGRTAGLRKHYFHSANSAAVKP